MNMEGKHQVEFGSFVLELENRRLLRNGEPVALTHKTFDALVLFIEKPGKLLSKDELMNALWPDTFVDEANLTQTVSMLRKALGESGGEPRYVSTVPGYGYRFVAPVRVLPWRQDLAERSGRARRRWRRRIALVGVVIVAVGFLLSEWWSRGRSSASSGRVMLAVLPFSNLTGDPSEDYFSDGLTEEMISRLGQMNASRLGVIARTSVMRYKQSPARLEQIGRELGVQYLVEGSVRREADTVRVSAQLIQVKDQTHVWARQYDRKLTNVLAIQAEIAAEIANQIQLTFHPVGADTVGSSRQALSSATYQAYDLTLKGRYFFNKRTTEGFEQAIQSFQQAIAADPDYAPAYAGLAQSYALMGGYSLRSADELMPKARATAVRALQLDGGLPEAHAGLAVIAQNYDWDWTTAEREYKRAIELNPNYATAHHWYAECLALQGRFDEAFSEMDRARQLDPLSLIVAADAGVIQYYSGQYDRAIEQLRTVKELEPGFPRAYMVIRAYAKKGMIGEAISEAETWNASDGTEWPLAALVLAYSGAGRTADAETALKKLEQLQQNRKLDIAPLATAYTAIGKNEQAIDALYEAYAEHSSAITGLKVDPIYDPLRSNPRFQQLLRQVRLAQ